jgi:sarcosine oxidase
MGNDVEFLVIGGGAMGSAAAWSLAQLGHEVLLLERFSPGHVQGASHGATRNFNPAYSEPEYVRLLKRSNVLWDEISSLAGTELLKRTGLVNHGIVAEQHAMHTALSRAGFDSELLGISEAEDRFAGMKFETEVLHVPAGGQINADLTVTSLQQLASSSGAAIKHGQRVTSISVLSEDCVEVSFHNGASEQRIRARHAICTLGAWTQKLLGVAVHLPAIHVTEEHPVHFAATDLPAAWPGFNHVLDPSRDIGSPVFGPIYGMHTPGEGIKVGWHGSGSVIDPDHRPHQVIDKQIRGLQQYAERWLPGADPSTFESVSCTYASTEDEHFILDRFGPLTVGAGFSGHGFKFVPAIGEDLAALALGQRSTEAKFSASRSIAKPVFLERRQAVGLG